MDIKAAARQAEDEILPKKSKELYQKAFKKYQNWALENKAEKVDQDVMLAYFSTQTSEMAPNTRWTHYSMLKMMVNKEYSVDIGVFKKLTAFLKRKSEGYQPKKAKILELDHIETFLKDAPDVEFLAVKVAPFSLKYLLLVILKLFLGVSYCWSIWRMPQIRTD